MGMNDRYSFKAKRADNGEWVEGNLLKGNSGLTYICSVYTELGEFIQAHAVEVYPATLCQCTGLKDKNGRLIFEGDTLRNIPKNEFEKENYVSFEVFWHDNDWCNNHVGWQIDRMHYHGSLCGGAFFEKFKPKYVSKMIIEGNIFDNPELLEAKKHEYDLLSESK